MGMGMGAGLGSPSLISKTFLIFSPYPTRHNRRDFFACQSLG